MQILCEEVPGLDLLGVCKSGPGSELAVARDKDVRGGGADED
jgi:hypothetical protein